MKVDNAVILAAGMGKRFAPLSEETHKAMTIVRGEVLIERQIRQLISAGISDVYIVTGYKAEQFDYLKDRYGVKLIYNPEYDSRNNNGSIRAAGEVLCNSFVCSSDNYFTINPFEKEIDESYYAAQYSDGYTDEWCISEGSDGYIDKVTIGGTASWYMMGHTFWSEEFSRSFLRILESEYMLPGTAGMLWEKIYSNHLTELKMKIRRYEDGTIYEFDSLKDLASFDESYSEYLQREI